MNDIKRKFIEKMNISIIKEGKINNNINNNIYVVNKRQCQIYIEKKN